MVDVCILQRRVIERARSACLTQVLLNTRSGRQERIFTFDSKDPHPSNAQLMIETKKILGWVPLPKTPIHTQTTMSY